MMFEIDTKAFSAVVESVSKFVGGRDSTNESLKCALVECDGVRVTFTATDAYALGEVATTANNGASAGALLLDWASVRDSWKYLKKITGTTARDVLPVIVGTNEGGAFLSLGGQVAGVVSRDVEMYPKVAALWPSDEGEGDNVVAFAPVLLSRVLDAFAKLDAASVRVRFVDRTRPALVSSTVYAGTREIKARAAVMPVRVQ